MKRIFAATHGERGSGPNPAMTDAGYRAVSALARYLPEAPGRVHVGVGQRHYNVAHALNLHKHPAIHYSDLWGSAASVDLIAATGKKTVFLPDGRQVPYERYGGWVSMMPAIQAELRSQDVGDRDVICTGRDLIAALGEPIDNVKMASVYEITISDDGGISHRLIGTAA